jgi:hypothetical protein
MYHNPLSTSREKIIDGFRKFEDAIGNGIINLEQSFSLIQHIRRSKGIPTKNEFEIFNVI